MSLTETEASQAYEELASMLEPEGLGWIRIQVEERLALGKLAPRRIKARGTSGGDGEVMWEVASPRPEPKRASVFVVAEPYSQQERLDALVEAILLAVPTIQTVANAALRSLAKFGTSSSLAFEPEADVRVPYTLSAEEIDSREAAGAHLRELLNELQGGSARAAQTHTPR